MTKHRRRLFTSVTALLVIAVPALAQDNVDTLPPGQVRAFLAKFATCTVRKKGPAQRVGVADLRAGRAARFQTDDECGSASYNEARLRMSDEVHGT